MSLFRSHQGKVSAKWLSYLGEYEKLFGGIRSSRLRILEIGVQNGGSLEIWGEYFNNFEVIVGCDINADCQYLVYGDKRIKIVIGNCNTDIIFEEIRGISAEYDLIIDDGSHCSDDVVVSFLRYFPLLADGGLYIVEDMHCSYWAEFGGGLYSPYSSQSFFKKLTDIVNYEHWGVSKNREDLLHCFLGRYMTNIEERHLCKVKKVSFSNSMCVVEKGCNSLGELVVSGSCHSVVQDYVNLPKDFVLLLEQGSNFWSNLEISPEESWVDLNAAIAERDQLIAALEADILSMRMSRSWKVTKPLRAIALLYRKIAIGVWG